MSKLDNKIEKASRLITESKKVVVMTGAGISVDSGVPTFQGTEGLWARFGKPKMNAYSDFLKNPEEWWPWKLDPRNGHCATPSQWSRRKSREISGIVTENTRF